MHLAKDAIKMSVNSPNSGEGIENLTATYNLDDINIVFNSRYLIDIASQIENDSIIILLRDAGSPVMVRDLSDKNSFYVVMPMKIWFIHWINQFNLFPSINPFEGPLTLRDYKSGHIYLEILMGP